MIEVFKQSIADSASIEEKINRTRELLQTMILSSLCDKKFFNNIAFLGGTALRIVHKINRYSEDLDFSLIDKTGYSFKRLNETIVNFFKLNNILMETDPDDSKTVNSTFFKFTNILQLLGLSVAKNQKFAIKFEIDTNPPLGYSTENVHISAPNMFSLTAYDLPSMFAGKLHACHCRKYSKGRDYYDLMWYLGQKIKPNFLLLNNAIIQTENQNLNINETNLTDFIYKVIEKVDLEAAAKDVKKFLFYPQEAEMLNKTAFDSLLKYYNQ